MLVTYLLKDLVKGVIIMKDANDKTLWEEARKKAKETYEEETGEDWENADKYEREDYVFAEYLRLKGEINE